jgi:hypothetical protein
MLMTENEWVACIVAVPSTIAAISGFFSVWASLRNHAKITDVGKDINGRMSQFMAEKDKNTVLKVDAAHTAGIQEERDRTQ